MVDKYTKVVLTAIAVALVWLCLWGPAPKWGTPAEAQYGSTVDVNISKVGGQRVQVERPGLGESATLPVRVVTVDDTVSVRGAAPQMQRFPIEVTGHVTADVVGQPVQVEVK